MDKEAWIKEATGKLIKVCGDSWTAQEAEKYAASLYDTYGGEGRSPESAVNEDMSYWE